MIRDYLLMIATALTALLLGGWLPGGTWWLTPLASLALVALAFFGRHSPAVLLAMADGEPATIGRLAWAARYRGIGRLLLLALPGGLLQYNAQTGGQLVGEGSDPLTGRNAVTFRSGATPVQVTFVPDAGVAAVADNAPVRGMLRLQTRAASFVLPTSAQPVPAGNLQSPIPAARVAWGWADADLLPDLLITVRPDFAGTESGRENADSGRERTFYVPLTDTTIREQSATAAAAWSWAQMGYGVAGGFFGLFCMLRGLFWALARGANRRSSTRV